MLGTSGVMALAILLLSGNAWADSRRSGDCTSGPLNILLTHVDGPQAAGVTVLRRVLREAGHTVTVAAPTPRPPRSHASVALQLGIQGVLHLGEVVNPALDRVFVAGSTPAISVVLGASTLFPSANRPDLVIAGIDAPSIGPAALFSGTVGAAIAAITLLDPPIPAIAVGTQLPAPVGASENAAHLEQVADFVKRLVAALQEDRCHPRGVMSRGLALNVNYPALSAPEVKGVKIAEQGRAPAFAIRFRPFGFDTYNSEIVEQQVTSDVPHSDTIAFRAGYVTIVPLDGNYTAGLAAALRLHVVLRGLAP